jgi:hypothetical protein
VQWVLKVQQEQRARQDHLELPVLQDRMAQTELLFLMVIRILVRVLESMGIFILTRQRMNYLVQKPTEFGPLVFLWLDLREYKELQVLRAYREQRAQQA